MFGPIPLDRALQTYAATADARVTFDASELDSVGHSNTLVSSMRLQGELLNLVNNMYFNVLSPIVSVAGKYIVTVARLTLKVI